MKFWSSLQTHQPQSAHWVFNSSAENMGFDRLKNYGVDNTFNIPDDQLAQYKTLGDDGQSFIKNYKTTKQEQAEALNKSKTATQKIMQVQDSNRKLTLAEEAHDQELDNLAENSNDLRTLEDFIESQAKSSADSAAAIADFLKQHSLKPLTTPNTSLNQALQNLIDSQRDINAQSERIEQAFNTANQQRAEANSVLTEVVTKKLPLLERQQANYDILIQLKELRDSVDVNGDGELDEITPEEQIAALRLLSDRETTAEDRYSDERTEWGQLVDQGGRAVEDLATKYKLPESFFSWARRRVESDPKSIIVNMMSDRALQTFLLQHRGEAMALLTDKVGGNQFRVDFFGNDFLESYVQLVDLLPGRPPFISVGENQTAYLSSNNLGNLVYKYAHNHQEVVIDTNTTFTILGDLSPQHPELQQHRATTEQLNEHWRTQLKAKTSLELDRTQFAIAKDKLGIANFKKLQERLNSDFPDHGFANQLITAQANHRTQQQLILESAELSLNQKEVRVFELRENFAIERQTLLQAGVAEIKQSNLSPERKAEQLKRLEIYRQVFSNRARAQALNQAINTLETRKKQAVERIVDGHFSHLSAQEKTDLTTQLVKLESSPNPQVVLKMFLKDSHLGQKTKDIIRSDSDLQAKLTDLLGYNGMRAEFLLAKGRIAAAEERTNQGLLATQNPGITAYVNTHLVDSAGLVQRILNPNAENTLTQAEIVKLKTQLEASPKSDVQEEILRSIERSVEAQSQASEGAEALAANNKLQDQVNNTHKFLTTTPAGRRLTLAVQNEPDIANDDTFLNYLTSDNFDPRQDLTPLLKTIKSEDYKNGNSASRASLLNQVNRSPLQSTEAEAYYRTQVPSGLAMTSVKINTNGDIETRFTSDDTEFIQYNGQDLLPAKLAGLPEAGHLRVPPDQWATAQAFGALGKSFITGSGNRNLAQSAEYSGNTSLVTFFKNYWGIRGNTTLVETELNTFTNLGNLLSEHHMTFHQMLGRIDALRWDDTLDPKSVEVVRGRFDKILAAAQANNQAGFQTLLGLNQAP